MEFREVNERANYIYSETNKSSIIKQRGLPAEEGENTTWI